MVPPKLSEVNKNTDTQIPITLFRDHLRSKTLNIVCSCDTQIYMAIWSMGVFVRTD